MSQPNSNQLGEFNDDSLRKIAREIVVRRYALQVHSFAYVLVNIILFAINWFTDYTYQWHLWAIACWGVALAIHCFSYFNFRKGSLLSVGGGILAYHVFIYCLVNALLLFINWFTSATHTISWAIWPLWTWGVAVFIHIVFYFRQAPKSGEKKSGSWVDREVERELQRAKANNPTTTNKPNPPTN